MDESPVGRPFQAATVGCSGDAVKTGRAGSQVSLCLPDLPDFHIIWFEPGLFDGLMDTDQITLKVIQ